MPTQTHLHQQLLKVHTQGKTLHDITPQVETVVREAEIQTGLCVVFVRHTSASLIIQENADPAVLRDLNTFFAKLVPEDGRSYSHAHEGPDDMPAHIRAALTRTSEQIPITQGRLMLGTWQGIYLWEHRQRSYERQIVIHISGH